MKNQLTTETVQTATDALQCQLNGTNQQLDELNKSDGPFHKIADKARALIRTQLKLQRALADLKDYSS